MRGYPGQAALCDDGDREIRRAPSRAYYDRKRAQGKRHNQAIIALARRRTDVLFAMLRDGTLYHDPNDPQTASSVALAA